MSWLRCPSVVVLCCTTLLGGSAWAQATGQLRFRFEPDRDMHYVLDGTYRMNNKELTLMEGDHRFVFWAPERLMLDTSFRVEADRVQDVLVRLRYSPDFVDHRRALQRHELQQRWGRILPPIVAGGAGVWAGISLARFAKANSDLDDLVDSYATLADPARIQGLKTSDIPAAQDEFRAARTQAFVATGLFAVSLAGTIWLCKSLRAKDAPVYQDNERLRFEGLVWLPDSHGGSWSAALSIPLQ